MNDFVKLLRERIDCKKYENKAAQNCYGMFISEDLFYFYQSLYTKIMGVEYLDLAFTLAFIATVNETVSLKINKSKPQLMFRRIVGNVDKDRAISMREIKKRSDNKMLTTLTDTDLITGSGIFEQGFDLLIKYSNILEYDMIRTELLTLVRFNLFRLISEKGLVLKPKKNKIANLIFEL